MIFESFESEESIFYEGNTAELNIVGPIYFDDYGNFAINNGTSEMLSFDGGASFITRVNLRTQPDANVYHKDVGVYHARNLNYGTTTDDKFNDVVYIFDSNFTNVNFLNKTDDVVKGSIYGNGEIKPYCVATSGSNTQLFTKSKNEAIVYKDPGNNTIKPKIMSIIDFENNTLKFWDSDSDSNINGVDYALRVSMISNESVSFKTIGTYNRMINANYIYGQGIGKTGGRLISFYLYKNIIAIVGSIKSEFSIDYGDTFINVSDFAISGAVVLLTVFNENCFAFIDSEQNKLRVTFDGGSTFTYKTAPSNIKKIHFLNEHTVIYQTLSKTYVYNKPEFPLHNRKRIRQLASVTSQGRSYLRNNNLYLNDNKIVFIDEGEILILDLDLNIDKTIIKGDGALDNDHFKSVIKKGTDEYYIILNNGNVFKTTNFFNSLSKLTNLSNIIAGDYYDNNLYLVNDNGDLFKTSNEGSSTSTLTTNFIASGGFKVYSSTRISSGRHFYRSGSKHNIVVSGSNTLIDFIDSETILLTRSTGPNPLLETYDISNGSKTVCSSFLNIQSKYENLLGGKFLGTFEISGSEFSMKDYSNHLNIIGRYYYNIIEKNGYYYLAMGNILRKVRIPNLDS